MNTSDDVLRCPITMELFYDPVLAPDGHTYERKAIEQWIQKHGTSPMTRQSLFIEQLYPNRTVKELVDTSETLLRQKNDQFILNVYVKKKNERPFVQTIKKTIYSGEWVVNNNNNQPEIILLKIDGTRARNEVSFYINLSHHLYIIRIVGLVYDRNNLDQNDTILLLQEYISEGSLYELLQKRCKIPDEKILIQIFLQIIEAMIWLTHNHIVHGNLACRNVLVFDFDENQPQKIVVKITDFSLSRYSQRYSMKSDTTRITLNLISIRYVAPELLSSNATSKVYTEKSDMYSMGVSM